MQSFRLILNHEIGRVGHDRNEKDQAEPDPEINETYFHGLHGESIELNWKLIQDEGQGNYVSRLYYKPASNEGLMFFHEYSPEYDCQYDEIGYKYSYQNEIKCYLTT
jgi:hypothetical protein